MNNNEKAAKYAAVFEAVDRRLQEAGIIPVFFTLYGSQNYEIDTVESDFVFYVAAETSFEDFVYMRSALSTKLNYEYGEIVVKDIREAFKQFKKGAFNALEVLSADTILCINPKYEEELARLYALKDRISVIDPHTTIRSLIGAAGHSCDGDIGPKKTARVLQFANQLSSYCNTISVSPDAVNWNEIMRSKAIFSRDFILDIKTNTFSKEYLSILAQNQFNFLHSFGTDFLRNYTNKEKTELIAEIDNILMDICRKKSW